MNTSRICQQCRKPVPETAPEGLCPECLAKVALGSEPAAGGSRVPPEPADLARQFPQLEIIELLGMGGMGMVYTARQPKLDRLVALKILPIESGHDDVSFAERFEREAKALARLNHPGIVAVYDFGQTKDYYYFVMEYVDGMNLRQLLQSAPVSPHHALELVMQICTALQFAHDAKVVHRDIKPENILINKKGQAKIADFGLAKLLGTAPETNLTSTQVLMGSINYMAPEQREKPLEVDHRADIYSLGVVFYEMLTGEVPMGHFEAPSKRVQVDVRLDEVVLHALEREPARRYQKASDVRTGVETIATTMKPSGAPGAMKPSPDSRRFVIPLLLVVATIAIIAGIMATDRHPAQLATPAASVKPAISAESAPIAKVTSVSQLGPRWTNSLGMVFAPIPGTSAKFSIWDTRVQDFTAFANETGYQTGWTWSWRHIGTNNGGHWVDGGWKGPELDKGPLYPVCGMSWYTAHAFCRWLTEKEHKSGLLNPNLAYRLPKEEEWSAAFGNTLYPWGEQWPPPSGAGNYDGWTTIYGQNFRTAGTRGVTNPDGWTGVYGDGDKYARTSPVGSFRPNLYGLYDMGGNVQQWSEESYGTNPDGVLRGGSWDCSQPADLQSSHRGSARSDCNGETFGFRCVISGVESNAPAAEAASGSMPSVHVSGEIHNAARDGDLATVKALLKDNPNLLFAKDDEGDTPLLWAACRGHTEVVELLLASKAEVNAKDNEGLTPLHWAAQRGYKDVAALLLAANAEVNGRDNEGDAPLLWAACKDQTDVVELLLANKAEVNTKDNEGLTPLHWAAQRGYKAVAALLLASNADINARDNDGLMPLHWAANKGYKDMVEFLLANRAEINARDQDGRTPLHWAADKGHKDVAELLLARKADATIKDNSGRTALRRAEDAGHEDVAALLRQSGGKNP